MGFSDKLIEWYHQNKRDLPWRNNKNAYSIWLSEIILQQTRVDQGLSYFEKFIEHYPTVDLLANSSEKEVLNLWQGLGYYSRARNLHATAKIIAFEKNNIFPNDYNELLKLKGVGEYTAAAIASFAYNLPYSVVDGNVYRVLSRIFGIADPIDSNEGKKVFKQLAADLLDQTRPADYNQAIMEFGALCCTPKNPKCERCPFQLECYALKNDQINVLPIKEKKIKQRDRYFNYLVLIEDDFIYLNERKNEGIWKGLYDFPLIETDKSIQNYTALPLLDKRLDAKAIILHNKSSELKHVLSHQKIYATFWLVKSSKQNFISKNFVKVPLKEINNFPVPKLIDNYLKSIL